MKRRLIIIPLVFAVLFSVARNNTLLLSDTLHPKERYTISGVVKDSLNGETLINAITAVPEMLRGTVVTHRRRCGKPNCRCATGEELHEQVLLSYSLESRARSVTLPGELIEPVRQATQRYREARLRLEKQGNAGLEALVGRLKQSS